MKIDLFEITAFIVGLAGVTGFIFGITWLTVWLRDKAARTQTGQKLGIKLGAEVDYLQRGQKYRVITPFTDYYNNQFTQDEILTYKGRDFLPYHGGHTIFFEERNAYFQEIDNADILASFPSYFEAVTLTPDGSVLSRTSQALKYVQQVAVSVQFEVPDEPTAHRQADTLLQILQPLGDFQLHEVKRNPQLAEYFEISVVWFPETGEGVLEKVTAALGENWLPLTRSVMMLESRAGRGEGKFIPELPEARWAHVQISEVVQETTKSS